MKQKAGAQFNPFREPPRSIPVQAIQSLQRVDHEDNQGTRCGAGICRLPDYEKYGRLVKDLDIRVE